MIFKTLVESQIFFISQSVSYILFETFLRLNGSSCICHHLNVNLVVFILSVAAIARQ